MKKYFSNIRREDLSLFAIKALTVTAVLGTAMLFFEARYRIGIDTQKHPCVDAHVFLWDMYDRKLEKGNLYVFETAVRQIRPPFSMKKACFASTAKSRAHHSPFYDLIKENQRITPSTESSEKTNYFSWATRLILMIPAIGGQFREHRSAGGDTVFFDSPKITYL